MKKFAALLAGLLLVCCCLGTACAPASPPEEGNGGSGGGSGGGETPAPAVNYQTYGSFWMRNQDYKTMPVGAFNACPPKTTGFTYDYLSEEQTFKDYREAGVNLMMGLYEYAGSEEVLRALDWCGEYGLSYLLPLLGADNLKSDSGPRSALSRVRYHDAFAGIMQSDEPGYIGFQNLADSKVLLDGVLPEETTGVLWHANLFPIYAGEKQLYFRIPGDDSVLPEGGYSYRQYVEDYIRICSPQILSYDYYPLRGSNPELSSDYFVNMSLIRGYALEENIPFWVYIQTCSFNGGVRIPNEADLLWQVNTALSYGAKGIQYFTGVLPVDGVETFEGALFDRDGNRTEVYDYVKTAGRQLSAVDEVLMCAKSKGVVVAGETPVPIPEADVIESYGKLAGAEGEHALVGCFDYEGRTTLYVTNNTVAGEGIDEITLRFSESVSGYRVTGGEKTDFSGAELVLSLSPGEGALVVLE